MGSYRAHQKTKRILMTNLYGAETLSKALSIIDFLKNRDLYFFLKNTRSLWISRLLIELQSSSKNKNNPQNLFIWGGDTFQSSIYHTFPLKPGCVKKNMLNKDANNTLNF